MGTKITNWAGNYEYSTGNIHYPETIEQLQALVKDLKKLRVLGTRHSFNSIADSSENLISLEYIKPQLTIDPQRRQVSIGAGIRYAELCQTLHQAGFALHNLASLPHISVIGACATATHGSGVRNQNLSSAVSALEIINSDGELVSLSREQDGFEGAVVGLGALGIVINLTLDLQPAFDMRQEVYLNLPLAEVENHFDEIMSSAYSVSLFTDWQGNTINQVWLKKSSEDQTLTEFYGAVPASRHMHPIAELSAENCTYQLGITGPWHQRLPHFRIDATPSAGNELQSEYFVSRQDAILAMRALAALRDEIAPHLLISEVRTIAADNLWMSPCYQQDSVAFHFTWKPDWTSVKRLLPKIEAQLAPFNARPHWGKLFTMPPQRLQALYKRLSDFQGLLQQYDPQGKFRNEFLNTNLFGS
jgi:alditol oxidase